MSDEVRFGPVRSGVEISVDESARERGEFAHSMQFRYVMRFVSARLPLDATLESTHYSEKYSKCKVR